MKVDLGKLLAAAEVVGLSLAAGYAQSRAAGKSLKGADYQGAAFSAIPTLLSSLVTDNSDPVPVTSLIDGLKEAATTVTNAVDSANQAGQSLHSDQWTGIALLSGISLIDKLRQSITSPELTDEQKAAMTQG